MHVPVEPLLYLLQSPIIKILQAQINNDYGNGGNYISSLKPGESIQVNMAWIVNENELDHMYLNLNGEGGGFQFSNSTVKSGVVDICQ